MSKSPFQHGVEGSLTKKPIRVYLAFDRLLKFRSLLEGTLAGSPLRPFVGPLPLQDLVLGLIPPVLQSGAMRGHE